MPPHSTHSPINVICCADRISRSFAPVHSALGLGHPPPHDACCPLHSPQLNADNVTKPARLCCKRQRSRRRPPRAGVLPPSAACDKAQRLRDSTMSTYTARLAALTRRRLERTINRRAGTETGLRMGPQHLIRDRDRITAPSSHADCAPFGAQVTANEGTTSVTCSWTQTHSSGPQTQVAFAGWTANKSPTARTEPAMCTRLDQMLAADRGKRNAEIWRGLWLHGAESCRRALPLHFIHKVVGQFD
jgi:hypothetical protein